jgi:aromatic ring-opening dioxygenase catalytic subunit (LigB family)
MATIVAAMATSHAFAFMDPMGWEDFLQKNRQGYRRRYGVLPEMGAEFARETVEGNVARYSRVRAAHDSLQRELHERRPDLLLLVGDDQDEHYHADNIPQIAVYTGGDFRTAAERPAYKSGTEAARLLLSRLVEDGFDVSICGQFANDRLISHAHVGALDRFVPDRGIPVVPIFVNGIHVPALEPFRCHALGHAMRTIIANDLPRDLRVAVIASGGLSHFTAGYPWPNYRGPFHYGDICVDFDRSLIAAMSRGDGESLARLKSDELLWHGGIEFRCWLVVLGMVGKTPLELMAYEPFYRAIMGVGVGRWNVA